MEVFEASILLSNLINRIEEKGDDGRGTLPGAITADEITALRLALTTLQGSTTAPPVEAKRTPAHAEPSLEQLDEPSDIELNLSALAADSPASNVRFCLDFGTAMSKATLVREMDDGSEEVDVLNLGVPGEQELIDEQMLISSIFIDQSGSIWFGRKAVDKSLQEGSDGTHQRVDSIKRRLSEDGWDERVIPLYNPTAETVTYGELILAYLTFLTWAANRCLEELGYSPLLSRRFAMPCFEGQQKRREFIDRLGKAVGDAQVLADTFGEGLTQGLALQDFLRVSRALRQQNREYVFVDEDVTEPMGVAGSIPSDGSSLDHLVLVVDVGAGTSDLGLYRIHVDPKESTYVAREVEQSTRVLTEAGDHLDNLLTQFVLAKAGIKPNDPNIERILGQLRLRIREYKESLFRDSTVFVALSGSPNRTGVDIELEEFCDHGAVRQFGESLKIAITGILESVDDSWVDWIRAHPTRRLVMVLAGGGSEMPMVRNLADEPWTVSGKEVQVQKAVSIPQWLDQQLEDIYPRIAVSLGGARRNLIKETIATITAGDVGVPGKLGVY